MYCFQINAKIEAIGCAGFLSNPPSIVVTIVVYNALHNELRKGVESTEVLTLYSLVVQVTDTRHKNCT